MKIAVVALVLILVSPWLATGQGAGAGCEASDRARALCNVEAVLTNALRRNDVVGLSQIYADEFQLINYRGRRVDKTAVLAAIRSGALRFDSLRQTWSVVSAGLIAGSAVLVAQSIGSPKPSPNAGAQVQIVTPGEIKWSDPPAGVARGTPSIDPGGPLRYAALRGDPLKPGAPFAIRLQCADGYKVAPHWHPEDENIVVLKGTFSVGTGDRFDPAQTRDIPAGGYGLVPGRMNHFATCKGETDFFVYGIGPRLNHWVPGTPAKR